MLRVSSVLDNVVPVRRQKSVGHLSRRSSYSRTFSSLHPTSHGTGSHLGGSTGNISFSCSSPSKAGNQDTTTTTRDRSKLRLVLPTVVVAAPTPPDIKRNRLGGWENYS